MKSLQEVGVLHVEGSHYTLTKRFDELLIPDTIQDVIMARIDRLAEAPKKTLQLASVIGRSSPVACSSGSPISAVERKTS